MRNKRTRVNKKTLLPEDVIALTCPRCGEEEVLRGARIKKAYTLEGTLITVDGGAHRKELRHTDVCSNCVQAFIDFFEGRPAAR